MRYFVPLTLCTTVIGTGSCAQTAPVPAPATTPFAIVAHRGASHDAPENTLAAFTLAWNQGADAIEGDFHLSKDGQIVCHHDETTERTAGVNRPVAQQTLVELKELDFGRWKHARWAGQRIPTLAEVLETVPAGKSILIEIKVGPDIIPYLLPIIETCGLDLDQVIVISFNPEVVAEVKRKLPAIKAYWLSGFEEAAPGTWRPTAKELVETATRLKADGVDLNANPEILDKAFVRTLRAAGLEFHVWTINDPAFARRMIQLGADSITTDRPGWLRQRIMGLP